MPHCLGCSTFFENLTTQQCGRCDSFESKPKENWRLCSGCGSIYEHLEADRCGRCLRASAPSAPACDDRSTTEPLDSSPPAIQYAMTHSVNPRTHSNHGAPAYSNPYSTPLTAYANNRDYALREEAERLTSSVGGSYVNAVARAQPGVRPAKSKISKTSQCARTPISNPKYNIIVRSIVNQNKERMKVSGYTPNNLEYDESTLWSTVLNDIRLILDTHYSKEYGHRIRSLSGFVLCYLKDRTRIPDFSTLETVGHVWLESIKKAGLHVQDKDIKLFKLELMTYVAYPLQIANTNEDEEMTTTVQMSSASKRTHTTSVSTAGAHHSERCRPAKRVATGIAGSSAYLTSVEDHISETAYSVIQTTCLLDSENKIRFTRSSTLSVQVDDKKFASGKTKNAYKMQISGVIYAAKRFYFTGKKDGSHISHTENHTNLRQEMVLATVATKCLERFNTLINENSINSFDLKIAKASLITVAEGGEKGLCWIVDLFLGDTKVTKFSGTDQAGLNTNLAGMTADAFAHFSLHDSDGNFVLVDIQGIFGNAKLTGGRIIGPPLVTLFDLMAHSMDKSMGLGDRGSNGIKQFRQQHICNRICVELGMDGFEDGLLVSKGDSHSDGEDIDAPGYQQNSAIQGKILSTLQSPTLSIPLPSTVIKTRTSSPAKPIPLSEMNSTSHGSSSAHKSKVSKAFPVTYKDAPEESGLGGRIEEISDL